MEHHKQEAIENHAINLSLSKKNKVCNIELLGNDLAENSICSGENLP
jgi:hypothetical protein